MLYIAMGLFLAWAGTALVVSGPLVLAFSLGVVPIVLAVPLLASYYFPLLFGALVSVSEKAVHRRQIKYDEEYQKKFEVGSEACVGGWGISIF